MRLGFNEENVTQLLGVTEHCRGLSKVTAGMLLDDDRGSELPLLPYPHEHEVDSRSHALLKEIAAVESARLGYDGVPKVWRVLSRNRHYLDATWTKHQTLLSGPGIDPLGRLAVGLAVSVTNASRYFVRYFTAALSKAGWDSGRILEIIGVVDHYNSLNTIASGMQIDSDIRPEGA